MSETEHTGRCLCGAVRYRATGAPKWIANCHCESCRRATGAPLTTYAGFAAERFAYVAGAPVRFHSSPGVTRTFCARCGTPLTYEGARSPGEVHVLIGTMDRPQDFPPRRDAFAEERLPWVPPISQAGCLTGSPVELPTFGSDDHLERSRVVAGQRYKTGTRNLGAALAGETRARQHDPRRGRAAGRAPPERVSSGAVRASQLARRLLCSPIRMRKRS